jgi:predicted HD superfamily hydrolase involved in NAD metabolism
VLPATVEARLTSLPLGLRQHIERSRQVGRDLALRHGVDVDKVDLGVASHDVARATNGEVLLAESKHLGLRVHPVERQTPMLLHGRIGAKWLELDDGVSDADVLEAVRWHTTGRRDMGPIAKIVFLADKLDPEKISRYPRLERVAALAEKGPDAAILEYLNQELEYLLQQRLLIHPASVAFRNQLLAG